MWKHVMGGTNSAKFGHMALREFTGDDGREWHVWDITPDKMHPSTRAEDYLQGVLEGWLVFEAVNGPGKARLYPIPPTWATATENELRALLRTADGVREPADRKPVVTRGNGTELATSTGPSTARGTDREVTRAGQPSMDVRTFRYPQGRVWTVAERCASEHQEGESRVVLRFASGARILDMDDFPTDWMHYSDDGLIDLLCVAFPRPSRQETDSVHQRRRGDTTRS